MPLPFANDYVKTDELGANWRMQFYDADGIPLSMRSFEAIDFGAISYKEIFQNVKTILATPLFSAALERTLGIDQRIVDLPIDRAAEATVAILDALTYWESRVEVMNIEFDPDVLNGRLGVDLRLKIKNVIYGTNTIYDKTTIYEAEPVVPPALPPDKVPPIEPIPGPPGAAGQPGEKGERGSKWFTGTSDPTPTSPDPALLLPLDMYQNTTTGDVFQFDGTTFAYQGTLKRK